MDPKVQPASATRDQLLAAYRRGYQAGARAASHDSDEEILRKLETQKITDEGRAEAAGKDAGEGN